MARTFLFFVIFFQTLFLSCDEKQEMNWQNSWECNVFPAEHEISQDEDSGAKIVFATTSQSKDLNLYFDLNCRTADLSMLVFTSDRTVKALNLLRISGEMRMCVSPISPGSGKIHL